VTGSIPSEIKWLRNLVEFEVYSTKLTGPIPSELAHLVNLTEFVVSGNCLTGTIPSQLSVLTRLSSLDITDNSFSGTFPGGLCGCTNIINFDISSNLLSGSLVDCLSATLEYYIVDENYFTGSINSNFQDYRRLIEFNTAFNALTGTIPTFLSELSKINIIAINDNFFTGTLATTIGELTKMLWLDFSVNQLSGSLPSQLGLLHSLKMINTYSNQMTSTIPSEIGSCASLQIFYVNSNSLSGTVPTQLTSCSMLEYFVVSNNFLSGYIPSQFSSLRYLDTIQLNNNYFEGENLLDVGISPAANYVDISSNLFTGSLPSNWSSFVKLQYLYVDENYITGTIATTFGVDDGGLGNTTVNSTIANVTGVIPNVLNAKISLVEFSLSANYLTGTMPSTISTHTALALVSLGSNLLTGTIPSSVVKLVDLSTFNVSNNRFFGSLSDLFTADIKQQVPVFSFPEMEYLDISNNSFSGTIPDAVFMPPMLTTVAMETNCFSGSLPTTICSPQSLQSLVMNSISTSNACRLRLPGKYLNRLFQGILTSKRISGTLPTCLWSMSALKTLHLAGNALSGTIPDVLLSPSLASIQLGINRLTGTIPLTLQSRGNFSFLGLQHNKLTGTLANDFAVGSATDSSDDDGAMGGSGLTLKLHVNRLSGEIPSSFYEVQQINVLVGNIFNCRSNDDLPVNDPARGTYVCGSEGFNAAIYVWSSVIGILLLSALILIGVVYYISNYSSRALLNRSVDQPGVQGTKSSQIQKGQLLLRESILHVYFHTILWYRFRSAPQQDVLYANTFQFLAIMKRASRGLLRIAAGYVSFCLCLFVVLKSYDISDRNQEQATRFSMSTVQNQYAWIVTSAYLHGITPAVLVMLIYYGSLLLISATVRSKRRAKKGAAGASINTVFAQVSRRISQLNKSSSSSVSTAAGPVIKKLSAVNLYIYVIVPFIVQLINFVVTLTVNSAYVSVLQQGSLTPNQQFMLQLSLSAMKLVWSSTYIPWSVGRWMVGTTAGYRLCHHVFMLGMQLILAPILASSYYTQNCFYNVFVPDAALTSTYSHTVSSIVCTENFDVDVLATGSSASLVTYQCGYILNQELVNTVTLPPYIYSYQCGSSMLTNYIPVLMYTYVFSALFLPLIRFLLLHGSDRLELYLPSSVFGMLTSTTLIRTNKQHSFGRRRTAELRDIDGFRGRGRHSPKVLEELSTSRTPFTEMVMTKDTSSPTPGPKTQQKPSGADYIEPFFDGSNVVAKRLLDFAVILTFGLACPILGLAVAVSVFTNAGVWRLAVGKFLSPSSTASVTQVRNEDCGIAEAPVTAVNSSINWLGTSPASKLEYYRLELSTRGLLLGSVSAMWVVTFVSCLFWSLMVFDMIGDVYGLQAGLMTVGVIVCCVPSLLYICLKLFDKYDVYAVFLGKYRLSDAEGNVELNEDMNSLFQRVSKLNSQIEMECISI
jgi:hypothetical protein